MSKFQKILLDSLQRHHWSLDEVCKPDHWWEAEIWVISSSRQQHGLRLFVTFIVDPGSLRSHDLSAVSEIVIARERLADWHAANALVSLQKASRSYLKDVEAAVIQLDEVRCHASTSSICPPKNS